jgi:hypothetical protein
MKPGSASSIELTIPHVKSITIKRAANGQHMILTASSILYKLRIRQEGAHEACMLSLAKKNTFSGTLSLA